MLVALSYYSHLLYPRSSVEISSSLPAMPRFLQYCSCESCLVGRADASRGKPWTDRLQWNLHNRSLLHSPMPSSAYPNDLPGPVVPSIEDLATSLFASVLVGDAAEPSSMVSRSVIETSTMPTPEPLAIEDLLESLSQIQLSTPLNTSHGTPPAIHDLSDRLARSIQLHTPHDIPPSVPPPDLVPSDSSVVCMPDKRDTNVASKRALQVLTHIEDRILLLQKSLVAPSEEGLGSAEAELSRLRSMFFHITRNTTLVLKRKEEIGRHLQRINSRICELRHLMPAPTLSDNTQEPIPYECSKSTF